MLSALPPEAWAVALAALPAMGPARLSALLGRWPPPEAWAAVTSKAWLHEPGVCAAVRTAPGPLADAWCEAARGVDVGAGWQQYVDARVGVATVSSGAYPSALAADIDPPPVVFFRGEPAAIAGPRVAIVGTRDATQYGLDVAYEFGRSLAASGVAVISGLALGIDGAAHAGALAVATAPPIAVVGSGLDVVYPRRHASLWRQVERSGVVVGEAPLGARPEPWRFPARNRIIAALADAVVVVESREHGGSMHTVAEAARRGRPVFAVPGPIRSAASAGTNRLLADGAAPACDADEILIGLGLTAALDRLAADPRPAPEPGHATVLDAIGWQPSSFEQLAVRVPIPLGELSLALVRLQEAGWITERGGWYERVAKAER